MDPCSTEVKMAMIAATISARSVLEDGGPVLSRRPRTIFANGAASSSSSSPSNHPTSRRLLEPEIIEKLMTFRKAPRIGSVSAVPPNSMVWRPEKRLDCDGWIPGAMHLHAPTVET